jgi:uncharacterized membrane protein YvlD (DUF360 family)
MKFTTFWQQFKCKAQRAWQASWQFLYATFRDKKNLIRFSLTVLALVITAQLLPQEKISYAGLGITFFIILSYISMMISAPLALSKLRLPTNTYSLSLFYWIAGSALLVMYDWIFWYFETAGLWWVLLYCAIIAIFNGIIENLLNDELH